MICPFSSKFRTTETPLDFYCLNSVLPISISARQNGLEVSGRFARRSYATGVQTSASSIVKECGANMSEVKQTIIQCRLFVYKQFFDILF